MACENCPPGTPELIACQRAVTVCETSRDERVAALLEPYVSEIAVLAERLSRSATTRITAQFSTSGRRSYAEMIHQSLQERNNFARLINGSNRSRLRDDDVDVRDVYDSFADRTFSQQMRDFDLQINRITDQTSRFDNILDITQSEIYSRLDLASISLAQAVTSSVAGNFVGITGVALAFTNVSFGIASGIGTIGILQGIGAAGGIAPVLALQSAVTTSAVGIGTSVFGAAALLLAPLGILVSLVTLLGITPTYDTPERREGYVSKEAYETFERAMNAAYADYAISAKALADALEMIVSGTRDEYVSGINNIVPDDIRARLRTEDNIYNICVAAADCDDEEEDEEDEGNCTPTPVDPVRTLGCFRWEVIVEEIADGPGFPGSPARCGWVYQCAPGQICNEGTCEDPPEPVTPCNEDCLDNPPTRPEGLGDCWQWVITGECDDTNRTATCGWRRNAAFDFVNAATICARDGGTWNNTACICIFDDDEEEPEEECPDDDTNEAACDARGWVWTPATDDECGMCDAPEEEEEEEPEGFECGEGEIGWPPADPVRCVSECTVPCTEHNAQGLCVSTYPPRPSLNHFQIPATCGWYDNCTQNPDGTPRSPSYSYVTQAAKNRNPALRNAAVGACLPTAYINTIVTGAADCARAGGTWTPDINRPNGGDCSFPPPVVVPEPGPCQTVNLIDATATPPEYEVVSLCLDDEICVNNQCRPRPVMPPDTDDPFDPPEIFCRPGTVLDDSGTFCRELTVEEQPCVGFDITVDINDLARQEEVQTLNVSIVKSRCSGNAEPIVFGTQTDAELRMRALELVQPGVAADLAGFANSAARYLDSN